MFLEIALIENISDRLILNTTSVDLINRTQSHLADSLECEGTPVALIRHLLLFQTV